MKIALRLPNWLGDIVMALPAIEGMLAWGEETHLFVPATAHELLGAHFAPRPTRSRLYTASHGLDREMVARLCDIRPDAGILLTHSLSTATVLMLARVPRRLGTGRGGRGLLLTDRLAERNGPRHQIDEYLEIARGAARVLGMDSMSIPADGAAPRMHLDAAPAPRPRLVLAPGAAKGPAKRWPAERYARIAREAMEAGRDVVLLGAPGEEETGKEISRLAPDVDDRIGRTSLLEAARILASAERVLTNDSGLAHLAGALAIPSVILFGPTNPARTAPRAERQAVVQEKVECSPCELPKCPIDHRCMTRLDETRVLAAIRAVAPGWPA